MDFVDRFFGVLAYFLFWPATAANVIRIAASQSRGRFSSGHRALREPNRTIESWESKYLTFELGLTVPTQLSSWSSLPETGERHCRDASSSLRPA